jgi:hypothetical protein
MILTVLTITTLACLHKAWCDPGIRAHPGSLRHRTPHGDNEQPPGGRPQKMVRSPWIAAAPSAISSATPAIPTTRAIAATSASSSSAPSESTTTLSAGRVSRPMNGERAGRAPDHEEPEHHVAEPAPEQEGETRPGEPLQSTYQLRQRGDEPLLSLPRQLERTPAAAAARPCACRGSAQARLLHASASPADYRKG